MEQLNKATQSTCVSIK